VIFILFAKAGNVLGMIHIIWENIQTFYGFNLILTFPNGFYKPENKKLLLIEKPVYLTYF